MDIYSILSSKPHVKHYLVKYISFIKNCQLKNEETGYMEKHHICPKAKDMFPEYSSFKDNPWNKVELTARQHFIAHLLLWKVFPEYNSQTFAFWAMKFKNGEKINSKIYESLKKDVCHKISAINSNKIWINDGIRSTITSKEKALILIDQGWNIGRIFSKDHKRKISINAKDRYEDPKKNPRYGIIVSEETRKKLSEKSLGRKLTLDHKIKISKGSKGAKRSQETREKISLSRSSKTWITDGITNRIIDLCEVIPSGWKRGMTKSTKT